MLPAWAILSVLATIGWVWYEYSKKSGVSSVASIVAGKSGHQWFVQSQAVKGGTTTVVYTTPGSFGPTISTPIIQYYQAGTNVASRTLMWVTEDQSMVNAGAVNAAVVDFGVTVPSSAVLPGGMSK